MATSFLAASHDALMPGSAKRKRSKPAKKQVMQCGPAFAEPMETSLNLGQGDSILSSPNQGSQKQKKQKKTDSSEVESVLSSPESQRKFKKTKQDSSTYEETSDDGHGSDADMASPVAEVKNEAAPSWSDDQIKALVAGIERTLPKKDISKYATQLAKTKWEDIEVEGKTSDECKEKFTEILTKIRKFRTLTDIVADAKEWLKHPWMAYNNTKTGHPDQPKKPLTPFFKFMMAKRKKYMRHNPGLSNTELAKLIGEKFKELNPKKKEQYQKAFLEETEQYKEALEKFKKEHPEFYAIKEESHPPGGAQVGQPKHLKEKIPRTPQNALWQFVHHKMEKHLAKHPDHDKREVADLYKKKYKEMKDSKKMVWIMKALEDKARFDEEMAGYCSRHPGFQPKEMKFFITKDEQKVKDRQNGKPEKPAPNGYSMYTAEVLSMLSDSNIPNTQKMSEVARKWKNLTEAERQGYGKKAHEAMQDYKLKYEVYKEGLSEEERMKLEAEENKGKKNKKSPQAAPQSRPQKPISAMFIFMNEKKEHYKKKNPDLSDKELNQHMIKLFSELSEHKKEKYKKMEADHKAEFQTKVADYIKKGELGSLKTFPGEPKKPPGSGYVLYCSESLHGSSTFSNIPSNQRMAEISSRWKQMEEGEREEYRKRRNQLYKKYQKDVEKFKNKLSPEEREQFEAYLALKNNKTPKKKAPATPSTPAPEESESESGSSSSESESESESEEEEEEETNAVQANGPTAPTKAGSGSSSSGSSSESSSDDSSSSGSESSSEED